MKYALPFALPLFLTACAVPSGPVEVTRFSLPQGAPEAAALGHGTIATVPGPGMDGASPEQQSYQIAVEQALSGLGYTLSPPDTADQIAQVRFAHGASEAPAPVSIGFGAAGSTHASVAGLGITIPFRQSQHTATDLIVVIRDRLSGKVLWEGRSSLNVASSSPLAKTALGAPSLARALFKGFPGESGATVQVPVQ